MKYEFIAVVTLIEVVLSILEAFIFLAFIHQVNQIKGTV